MKKVILLFSGGVDSTTLLALLTQKKYDIYALIFDYGQKHNIEIKRAKKLSKIYKVKKHLIFKLNLSDICKSALTGTGRIPKDLYQKNTIPSTYVPARNTIFLSLALGWAETVKADEIYIGVNHIDYSGYPDCRPNFIKTFQKMSDLAVKKSITDKKIKIKAPLINMNKTEIIRLGRKLGVDYNLTWSCYSPTPSGKPCGKCDSCYLRKKGMGNNKLDSLT
jgi:7-cyano-7-deazaguanine synthase